MKNKQIRLAIIIVSSLVVSIVLALFFPSNVAKESVIHGVSFNNEESIIAQRIESIRFVPSKITKIFYKDKLLGVVNDYSVIEEVINKAYQENYAELFEDSSLNLDSDIYTVSENSFWNFEDKDKEIANYIYSNELFEIKAIKIEIYNTKQELQDTVYVKDENVFSDALKRFVLSFTSEDTYQALENRQVIPDVTDYGVVDKNVYIKNVIKSQISSASYDQIMVSEDEIYNYLCFGENPQMIYYTVKEYDTVSGVATKNGMTPSLISALNKNITSIDQALVPGMQINVTPYNTPIIVVVEKQRLSKEIQSYGIPEYHTNKSLPYGSKVQVRQASYGYNDVVTEEIWENGVSVAAKVTSTKVAVEPLCAVYEINGGQIDIGIQIGIPIDYPVISCDFYGYEGHHGCDFINRLDKYGKIYCVADGTVTMCGLSPTMGYFCYIDIGQGYTIRYLHMYYHPLVQVGDYVVRGQQLGNIGNTGQSTGPHLDIGVIYKGNFIDPCTLLPCTGIPNWHL